jgi:uncharacterized RDD family membrane protein YckC
VIDSLFFFPLLLVDIAAIGSNALQVYPALRLLRLVVGTLGPIVYRIAMHAALGQTVGKIFTDIKVQDITGTKLSVRQAILRDLIPLILCAAYSLDCLLGMMGGLPTYLYDNAGTLNNLTLAWPVLEAIVLLSNPKRRAIHDFIAGSVVVRTIEDTARSQA